MRPGFCQKEFIFIRNANKKKRKKETRLNITVTYEIYLITVDGFTRQYYYKTRTK